MRTQSSTEAGVRADRTRFAQEIRSRADKLAVAIVGALMSYACIPGGYYPFSAAYMAAVPQEHSTVAAIGSVIGCLLREGVTISMTGLRQIASILAVAGIRWALSELKNITSIRLYPFFTAFSGVLLTSMVVNGSTGEIISYSTIFYALEAAMAGIFALLFGEAHSAVSSYDDNITMSRSAAASFIITACIAILPICGLEIFGISPGFILVHTIVLLMLPTFRELGGAVGGIAAGGISALSQSSLASAAILPAAGLLAGYIAPYSRIFAAACYISIGFIGGLSAGTIDYTMLVETIIAGVISCVVPAGAVENLLSEKLHLPIKGYARQQTVQCGTDSSVVAKRLDEAAEALTGVCSIVEKVSGSLDKLNSPDIDTIYRRSASKVCTSCSCMDRCWKTGDSPIGGNIKELTDTLNCRGFVTGGDITNALGKKCICESQLAGEINRCYGYHIAMKSSKAKISRVRSVINDQLDGVGMLLAELGREIDNGGHDDLHSAELLTSVLEECGYMVDSVKCTINRAGRLCVTAALRLTDHVDLPRNELGDFIGETLCCDFNEPSFGGSSSEFTIRLLQRQNYRLCFGGAQHCCDGERLCGDAYDAFIDGEGNAYMLISDGMGSGGRAAVDGAMACELLSRLLKAGFSYEGAVKIVNSELLIKSDDESLSTIDSLRFNLYSGRAMFCKAGAAQSYHVRDGVVNRIDVESLPLGILRNTDTAQYCFTAEDGDIIVMLSDGVPTDDSMWFEKLLKQYDGEPIRDFSKHLLEKAIRRRPNGEDDDITVIVGKIIAA